MDEVTARVRRRVWVSGRVQGVWFRDACRHEALAWEVAGWVCNLPDGRVEAVFEGKPEGVDALVAWCRRGPRRAHVVSLEVREEDPVGDPDFRVR